MENVEIEILAEAMAMLDGKGNKFRECRSDMVVEDEFGYYEGYLSDAHTLMTIYKGMNT